MATKHVLERMLSPSEVRATVAASPEAVFAVLSDPETYPDWLAGAQKIRRVDPSFPEPGTRFDHEVGPSEGATVADDSTSVVSDPPHRLVLEVHVGRIRGLVDFQLERVADGTLVTFRESTSGALGYAMPLLRGPIFLRNRASLERLRQRFEPLVVRI